MEGVNGDKRVIKTATIVSKMPDKTKRDEWSEGGVTTLLNAYEEKWVIRNRAKLKGTDWEEIAHEVSSRDSGKKSVKAPNQCKNKIEAMKKRYRMESATSNRTWHFFPRMDRLLKGKDVVSNGEKTKSVLQVLVDDFRNEDSNVVTKDKVVDDVTEANAQRGVDDVTKANAQHVDKAQNGQSPIQENDQDEGSSKGTQNSEFSTPYNQEENLSERFVTMKSAKRRRSERSDVADSIRMLARSMLKIEQARMEMYRDTERIRAEAEIKRAEMDLKRTEIVSKTQLQIAKLLVKGNDSDTSGSSSLVAQQTAEEKSCKFCCLSLCYYPISIW